MSCRRHWLAVLAPAIVGLTGIAAAPALAAPPSSSAVPPSNTAPAGRPTLYLPDVFFVHHQAVTVPGRSFHVVGIVRPYVPGQAMTVELRRGPRVIETKQVLPAPSAKHTYGHFRIALASPAAGGLTIAVLHAATPQLGAFESQRRVTALDEHVGFGSTGRFVQLIQQRLAALHFYIPQTGVYDQGTGWAIDAYHRLLHRGSARTLDRRTISLLLDGFGSFRVRFPRHGRHAEGDLSLQLLALIDGSRVDAIYPISSGKPSTPTILGDYRIYTRDPSFLPDGMYYSDFFIRGYAIHGYDPAPDYPASHGCMRLPISDAISAYNWLALGDWVDVYN